MKFFFKFLIIYIYIRNRVIFEQYEPNWELEIQLVKTRLGYWAKGWCHDLPFSTDQFVNNLHLIRKWNGNTRSRRIANPLMARI